MEDEALNSSENDPAFLFSDHIKIEEDHPELVEEYNLLSDKIKKEYEANIDNEVQDIKPLLKQSHTCSQCDEVFSDIKFVKVHEAIHKSNLECLACNKIYKSKKYFVLHIQSHIKNPFRCQHCPEIYLDRRSYSLHRFTHKKIERYTCEFCSKEMSNKKSFQTHLMTHTKEKPFSCEACGKTFIQERVLRNHIAVWHAEMSGGVQSKFICEVCDGIYLSKSGLSKHKQKTHDKGRTFPCKNCGETFLNYQHMKDHRIEEHLRKQYSRICPLCSKEFYCRQGFMKHQRKHVEPGKELDRSRFVTSIGCYLCGEQTLGRDAFTEHQRVHFLMTEDELEECNSTKNFKCKVCGNVYNLKRNLFRHMDLHLDKTYECKTHCSKIFTYLGIRLHKEWYLHKYQCEECQAIFIGKKKFKEHRRIHRTPVKFTCKLCGREFRQRQLLATHWKVQHNIKCHLCLKKFQTHLALMKHIKIKHKAKHEGLVKIMSRSVRGRTYTCKICQVSFNTQLKHTDHMKAHKTKCYQCDNCKKNFMFLKNFMFHIKQNICLKYLDNRIGPDRFTCTFCNKEYNNLESLMAHTQLHTTIHRCNFCNSKFKQKDLQEHINRTHPEEAELSCDNGNLRFSSVKDLVKHKKYFNRVRLVGFEKGGVTEPIQDTDDDGVEENKDAVYDDHLVSPKTEPEYS